jgi:hypothetical protein
MSVNSVSTGLLPSYGPLSGNSSHSAKSAVLATEFPDKTSTQAEASQVADTEADGTRQKASAAPGNATSADPFQSTLEQSLREGHATAGKSTTGGTSESLDGQSRPGIAIYQRISQYGNNEPSTSALLKRWNTIMQSGQSADSAAASFAKALAQNETPGLESGVLDLTA